MEGFLGPIIEFCWVKITELWFSKQQDNLLVWDGAFFNSFVWGEIHRVCPSEKPAQRKCSSFSKNKAKQSKKKEKKKYMWHRDTVTEVFKHCINSPRSPGLTNFCLIDWFAFLFLFSNHFYLYLVEHLIEMACQSPTSTLNVEVSESFSHHLHPSFHCLASWNKTEKCICMTEKGADGWWAAIKSVPRGLLERIGHISDSYFWLQQIAVVFHGGPTFQVRPPGIEEERACKEVFTCKHSHISVTCTEKEAITF